MAQTIVCISLVDGVELVEKRPRALFTYREIVIAGLSHPLQRGIGYRDTQSRAHQWQQECQLAIGERILGVKAGHHVGCGRQGVGLVHHGVRQCDGEFADGV